MVSQDSNREANPPLYRYPDRLLYVEVLLFSLISTLMIFAWIPSLVSLFAYGKVLASAMRAMLFLNGTAIALILLFLFVKHQVKATVFYMNETVLCRRTSSGVVQLPLRGINAVSMIQFPFGSGAVLFESDGGSLMVPLFLRDAEEFFRQLEAACVSASAGQYNTRLWNRVHAIGKLSSFVDKRSQRCFGTVLGLSVSMLPATILIGAFFWDMSLLPLAVITVCGPLFPLAAYAAADSIIRHKEHWLVGGAGRALPAGYEETLLVRSAAVTAVLYLVIGTVYRMAILF